LYGTVGATPDSAAVLVWECERDTVKVHVNALGKNIWHDAHDGVTATFDSAPVNQQWWDIWASLKPEYVGQFTSRALTATTIRVVVEDRSVLRHRTEFTTLTFSPTQLRDGLAQLSCGRQWRKDGPAVDVKKPGP
jgi:hypothetical protein